MHLHTKILSPQTQQDYHSLATQGCPIIITMGELPRMWPQPLRIESISLHGNQSTETLATKAHQGMQFRHNYVKHVNRCHEGQNVGKDKIDLQDIHTSTTICICMSFIHFARVCVRVCFLRGDVGGRRSYICGRSWLMHLKHLQWWMDDAAPT